MMLLSGLLKKPILSGQNQLPQSDFPAKKLQGLLSLSTPIPSSTPIDPNVNGNENMAELNANAS